jgi:urease accessory protein
MATNRRTMVGMGTGTRTNTIKGTKTRPPVTMPTAPAEQVPVALLRLLHLVSPALPVGAYAYSQGLEFAVHAGWVRDEASTLDWLRGLAARGQGTLDLPVLQRLHVAWALDDAAGVARWTAWLLAAREAAELRAEDMHLGRALARILAGLDIEQARPWSSGRATFATLFALAAVRWSIGAGDAMSGYLWSWSENQVLAAVKLVPLGQSAGQRILHRLAEDIPGIVAGAAALADDDIATGAVAQAMAGAAHETQYTRLFRS